MAIANKWLDPSEPLIDFLTFAALLWPQHPLEQIERFEHFEKLPLKSAAIGKSAGPLGQIVRAAAAEGFAKTGLFEFVGRVVVDAGRGTVWYCYLILFRVSHYHWPLLVDFAILSFDFGLSKEPVPVV